MYSKALKKNVLKFLASFLILACVLLSSPGYILAEEPGEGNASEAGDELPLLEVEELSSQDTVSEAVVSEDQSIADPSEEQIIPATITEAEDDLISGGQNNVVPEPANDLDLVNLEAEAVPQELQASLENADNKLAENLGTGAGSENESTVEVNNNTDITNDNYAQVFNDSLLRADSGRNNASYNTGSGIITTQKAAGDGRLVNVINRNSLSIGGGGDNQSAAVNGGTGAGSENNSEVNINNKLTVKNINEANVVNRITADVNSGTNKASFNTGHGMVTTGDANLGLNFFSMANANLLGSEKFYANLQNIYSSYKGNVDLSSEFSGGSSQLSNILAQASNNSTGAGSSNQAVVNINDEVLITNQNSGKLNNEIDARIVSGQNKTNYNTGTGSIVSGKVNSSVNVINFLNSNITSGKWLLKTLNVFGNWEGDLRLPSMGSSNLSVSEITSASGNSDTGAGSDNSANSDINNSVSINNQNQAVIENNIRIKTNSGDNGASYNGGSGIVKVGSASAETNEMNVANVNVTGDSWWLVVVNRFGSWNGTAVGSPEAVAINSTGISTVLTPYQSGIDVVNNSTGSAANNSAGASINHKTDITNLNQADIKNNLNIRAISGENESQWNSGHGYIETGDIKGVNNIMNFANVNITTGNWVVVVVNVFGNWDGNLVFNPAGGNGLPIGGDLQCPIFNSSSNNSWNSGTGSFSENNSNTSQNNNSSVNNDNNANLNNTTDVSSTTGQNNANYNTGTGSISTGAAQTGSSVTNQANDNSTGVGGGGGTSSGAGNTSTGAGSENDSSSSSTDSTNIENENDSNVNNNVSGGNSTGQNSSNYNTGDAAIDTSWATTFLDIRNQVNENDVTLGDLISDFNQQPLVPGSQVEVPNNNSSTQVCPGVVIEITPSSYNFQAGETKTFTVVAKDSWGNLIVPQPQFAWTATGGIIDDAGFYKAGGTPGSFAVTATASYGNQAAANVTIAGSNNTSGGAGSGGGGGGVAFGGLNLASKRMKGDYNNDGKVDDLDFSILMANWGLKRAGVIAELNGDGIVGDADFSVVMSNWSFKLVFEKAKNISNFL